jgi:amidase
MGEGFPDLYEASVTSLQAGLDAGQFSSVDLVKVLLCKSSVSFSILNFCFQAYFARIEEVNVKGPMLRAVIEINDFALDRAVELDEERKLMGKRSELHGIPVLLKVCYD